MSVTLRPRPSCVGNACRLLEMTSPPNFRKAIPRDSGVVKGMCASNSGCCAECAQFRGRSRRRRVRVGVAATQTVTACLCLVFFNCLNGITYAMTTFFRHYAAACDSIVLHPRMNRAGGRSCLLLPPPNTSPLQSVEQSRE